MAAEFLFDINVEALAINLAPVEVHSPPVQTHLLVEELTPTPLNITNKKDSLNSKRSESSFTLCCTGQGLVMAEMSHAVISMDLRREMVQINKAT